MRWSRGALVGTVLAVVFTAATVWSPKPAAACSCAVATDREAFDRADTVFVGSVQRVDDAGSTTSSHASRAFVFDVSEVLKGKAATRQTVRTERSGAGCGLEIAGVGPFLVFAVRESEAGAGIELGRGEVYAGLCGGTRAIAVGGLLDASIDVQPRAPDPALVVEPPDSGSSSSDVVLRVVLFLLFVGVGIVGVWAVFLDRSPRIPLPDNLPPRVDDPLDPDRHGSSKQGEA